MKILLKKSLKPSERGLTFSFGQELSETFAVGQGYKYCVSKKSREVVIVPIDSDEFNHVSRKVNGTKVNCLIDIRSSEIKKLTAASNSIEIYVYADRIVVKIVSDSKEEYIEFSKALIDSLPEIFLFDGETLGDAVKTISLFCGAGLLDYSFIKEGFDISYAVDYSAPAIETYNYNLPSVGVCKSVYDLDLSCLPSSNVLIGGPSCKPFSSERSNRTLVSETEHFEGDNVDAFLENAISSNNDYDIAVMENVVGIKSSNILKHILSTLKPYYSHISWGILNNADLGGFQSRKRFILIASKIGEIPVPTDVKLPHGTVRDAFVKIDHTWLNRDDCVNSSDLVKKRMSFVRPGCNYTSIPEELRTAARHSNSYRRLNYNDPSPTIVNFRKVLLQHPDFSRCISVSEGAALQGLENDFAFPKSIGLSQMIQQVANGVPIHMGRAIGKRVMDRLKEVYRKPSFAS